MEHILAVALPLFITKDRNMKIILILLSVASSSSRFANLRRNGFYNHHRAGNNFRRSSQRDPPNGVRQAMNNKSERPVETDSGIFHDAAGPEVINELLMYDLLMDDRLMDDCAGNNFRRSSQSSPNGLRQMMNNKPERPAFTDNGIFHDAAGPEVIN